MVPTFHSQHNFKSMRSFTNNRLIHVSEKAEKTKGELNGSPFVLYPINTESLLRFWVLFGVDFRIRVQQFGQCFDPSKHIVGGVFEQFFHLCAVRFKRDRFFQTK